MSASPIRVQDVPVEPTPRLVAEARAWAKHGARPASIVTPQPGQLSVWDFPRPPAVQRVIDRVTITLGGAVIADSRDTVRVCETASPPTYYVPAEAFTAGALVRASGRSRCEWKGEASYWSLRHGATLRERCAWSYETPSAEYAILAGRLAVFAAAVDACTVAGLAVQPQPGQFYGGWITPDLVGPFKGDPGSSGW